MKIFKKGDKVSIIKESGELTVLEVKPNNKIQLEDQFGFIREVNSKDLSLIISKNYGLIPNTPKDSEFELNQMNSNFKQRKRKYLNYTAIPQIDLHIEKLRKDHLKLTVQEILIIQLNEFREFLKKCKENKIKKCIVIHGVGKGLLKSEIHLYLHRLDYIHYNEANTFDFGKGATEVIFSY